MCTVLLPPGVNPITVKKYIISYHINVNFKHRIFLKSDEERKEMSIMSSATENQHQSSGQT